ncbi:hypothetical protein GRI39_13445 [Altererythrobacter indicus]|uniref:O-antigen ligase-related domain-containing protein n=1 Tax=Altericroceibacterium indicum TaxID=374177 RepID=A0A845A9G9_9SPHN|nr:O-antigen ligase family protein [Altericroceibacterium indicum]MXP27032.1 hypothetical protein [Altericroceibacterium indicum]
MRQDYGLWLLLSLAVILGGGGRGYPLFNLPVQLAALVILGLSFKQVREFFSRASWPLKVLTCCTIALPLVQLIPLPPAIWSALPGRELVAESFALIGQQDRWFPISVAPSLTLLAAIGLIAPFAILVLASRLDSQRRHLALTVLVGLGLLNVLIGATQLITNGATKFYRDGSPNHLFGSFANHNSAGLFLVICLCALIGLFVAARPKGLLRMAYVATGGLLFLSVILSQSRSSMALLIIPLLLASAQALPRLHTSTKFRKRTIWAVVSTCLALLMIGFFVTQNNKLSQSFDRFDNLEDARPAIWEDSWVSRQRFWPVGAGFGSFDEVYQLDESLENLRTSRAGRAHNDYIETMVESGVIAPILIILWAAYLLWAARIGKRNRNATRWSLLAIAACLALQSCVDYPLRSQALFCIAALAIGLLEASRYDEAKGKDIASLD